MKIPPLLNLPDIQQAFRDLWAKVDPLLSGNIDMKGRRIINAGKSADPNDYVTKAEVLELIRANKNS
jgi:hypothetical protein